MTVVNQVETSYKVDDDGFLLDFDRWDEGFATETAARCGITSGLTGLHWRVLRWIRWHVEEFGACPLADRTCRATGLGLKDLRELFPSGFLRGACRMAGVTYDQGVRGPLAVPRWEGREDAAAAPDPLLPPGPIASRTFTLDGRGFLLDPEAWDEEFAVFRAWELKMPQLTDRHWMVIWFLRRRFADERSIPTIFETCEKLSMTLEELSELFPDGYHGGAIKISGLRERRAVAPGTRSEAGRFGAVLEPQSTAGKLRNAD